MNLINNNNLYRKEIDGIRAFAVLAVIINHFNKDLLPSGYLGVDIFFVISGYVITSSIYKRSNKTFISFILDFYERRVKRIFPALIFFIFIMSILICFFNPDPRLSLRTGVSALFGLSNLYLLRQQTNYFDSHNQLNVFTHTWSLGVEEQFYLLFPIIIWFTGFASKNNSCEKNLKFFSILLIFCSLISFIFLYSINQTNAYFLMTSRFWEISTGCLIFLIFLKNKSFSKSVHNFFSLITFLSIIGVFFMPTSFGGFLNILIVLLTAFLIYTIREDTLVFKLLTNKYIIHIGLISYSLYLWHWGIISISRWTIGINRFTIPLQITLIYSFAIISYYLIEIPLRKKSWSSNKLKTILKGIISIFISAISLLIFEKPLKGKLYLGNKSLVNNVQRDLNEPIKIDSNKYFGGSDCYLENNNELGNEINLEKCIIGDFKLSPKRVLIIGNSHSAALSNAFVEISKATKKYSFILTSSYGASPVREIPNYTTWKNINYYYWDKIIPNLLEKLRPGDIVFAVNDLNYDFEKQTNTTKPKLDLLEKGLINFSNELKSKSINLVFLHNLPYVREGGPSCYLIFAPETSPQWFNPFNTKCKFPNKSESMNIRKPLNNLLTKLENQNLLNIVDLFDVFCPKEECSFYNEDDILLYRDNVHPSFEAGILSFQKIKSVLDRL